MSRRTLVILLFASLALNLFVLGAAAGVTVLADLFHPKPPQAPMMAAAALLPEGQRDAYRESLNDAAAAARPKLRQARRLRREAWTRLGAEPLDAAGVLADLDRARALQSQAQDEIDRKIVELAAPMPAAQRAKLGAALAQPPQRRAAPPPGPQP
ncbi:MAG: hypothetical protein JWP73_1359 [Phenylobacterium sp.]|nr:hypothetical protein [Phenylobacterium sp.]